MKSTTTILLTILASTLLARQIPDYNVTLQSTMEWPDRTLAGCWGYTAPDGKEYALVGSSKGTIIVDISNPAAPVEIVKIPGTNSLWREVQTFGHYAFVSCECGTGMQIINLSALPSPDLPVKTYTGDGAMTGLIASAHTLHIDQAKGFVYWHGSSAAGATVVCDLNPDPWNPVFVGQYTQGGYLHDGYAYNDTLYAAEMSAGRLAVVDMSDKANPVILGNISTPAEFTHNTWLNSDHTTVFTTDETEPSFLVAWDISDPSDIQELDRFSTPVGGRGSIVHNVLVRDFYAISAWYTEGVSIVDGHRPQNLVQVGLFDTWAGSYPGFDGCWGAFPFFPSGSIIATNIPEPFSSNPPPGKLFILNPNYVRACYVEGSVKNGCNGDFLPNAEISINSNDPFFKEKTNAQGQFKTGQPQTGDFEVTVSYPGYVSQVFSVTLVAGEVLNFDVVLEKIAPKNIAGTVLNAAGQTLPNAQVAITNEYETVILNTDANGNFSADCISEGTYLVSSGLWGFMATEPITISANNPNLQINLEKGYFDDGTFDFNWPKDGNAERGQWVLEAPIEQRLNNYKMNPDADSPNDANNRCYLTENGSNYAQEDDVFNGRANLFTPLLNLADYTDPVLSFDYWYVNSGLPVNTKFTVSLYNSAGQSKLIWSATATDSVWRSITNVALKDFYTPENSMKIRFSATDGTVWEQILEAGVDVFRIVEGSVSAPDLTNIAEMTIFPNPGSGALNFKLPTNAAVEQVSLYDLAGRLVFRKLNPADSWVFAGDLASGIYRLEVLAGGRVFVGKYLVE